MSTSSEQPRVVAGRYRLRSVLGSGSMGTVWSAYDEFLHRPVAVKEMKMPHGIPAAQVDELRERTLREARAIAVLSHPNVIILHDIASENGDPFVVMELLPSRSLSEVLRDHGPLSVEQAAAVGSAVAAALQAAHASGITHRDVKPGNVLIAEDGRIKLTDFGIARNVSESTMTKTGIMLGSPAYIAPEVASGGAVTGGADLWGLGATLFAAVEGSPPYDADGDPLETVGKVVNGDVPKPSDGPLAEIIIALMDKEPTARLSLREVRQRLHSLQPKSPHDTFPAELFHTPDGKKTSAQPAPTDTQVIKVTPKKAEDTSSALASDPGPLPFLTDSAPPAAPVPPVKGRSLTAGLALTLTAILLFLLAAGGGFALARTVGGKSITPPKSAPTSTAPSTGVPAKPLNLVDQEGEASPNKGTAGGSFTIKAPEGWAKFVTQSGSSKLAPNTVVQFVSPDGTRTVNVQRFVDYYPRYQQLDAFLTWLGQAWPVSGKIDRRGTGDHDIVITYRTQEAGGDRFLTEREPSPDRPKATRTTFAHVFRQNNSLWVVSVTVPVEQEQAGRTELFDKITQTFSTKA
ncbi:serine/threonine-protein kinase [Amycolatopsis sp. cg5]|uniref:serine/threonine-protein kinase n=1 Tax=Amycolatopsis sp. cg5 TaxID=3238802 RepID=UPI0035253B3D